MKFTSLVISLLLTVSLSSTSSADDCALKHDFGDGSGAVCARRHLNNDDTLGGWVADTATVAPTAHVERTAVVYGNAKIFQRVYVKGHSEVYGDARLYDDAQIMEHAKVFGKSNVYGNARVGGHVSVSGNAYVGCISQIAGGTLIFGTAYFCTNILNVITTGVYYAGEVK